VTVETRYVATLNDILAIRITCKHCGAEYSIPLTHTLEGPRSCEICDAIWFGDDAVLEREAFSNFQQCIKVARPDYRS